MTQHDLALAIQRLPRPIARVYKSSFFRYTIGGGIAASVHLLIVFLAVELGGIDKVRANTLGFLVGITINYAFQRKITFRDRARAHAKQLPLFIGFAVVGLGLNRFVYSHCLHDLHVQYLAAAAIAILVVFVFNFLANSLVTFRSERPVLSARFSGRVVAKESGPAFRWASIFKSARKGGS